jgi:hypothetical protein
MRVTILGPTRPEVAESLTNLGELYRQQVYNYTCKTQPSFGESSVECKMPRAFAVIRVISVIRVRNRVSQSYVSCNSCYAFSGKST